MRLQLFEKYPRLKDIINIMAFIALVAIGTLFINTFIFRTFSVVGPSMENTLFTGNRLIVNRLPVTIAKIKNQDFIPSRGEIIVFKNPRYATMLRDEYIVKRVVAFEDETVTLKDGTFTVYNESNPDGFNPDSEFKNEVRSPISGEIDKLKVPKGEIFVVGDNRVGSNSLDSRNGLGTVPLYDIVGPVSLRILPINEIRNF